MSEVKSETTTSEGTVQTLETKVLVPRQASTTSKAALVGTSINSILTVVLGILLYLGSNPELINILRDLKEKVDTQETEVQEVKDKVRSVEVKTEQKTSPTPIESPNEVQELRDEVKKLRELILDLNKPPAPEPDKPLARSLDLKIQDIEGKEVTQLDKGMTLVVTSNAKSWSNVLGSSKSIPIINGFVVFPTGEETLVFIAQTASNSVIRVLNPKKDNAPQVNVLRKLDELETAIADIEENTDSLLAGQRKLEIRVTALEGARPPPSPIPPNPNPIPVTSRRVVIVEPVNAHGVVNRTPTMAKLLNRLDVWDAPNTSYRRYASNTPEAEGKKALQDLGNTVLPGVVVYNQAGIAIAKFSCAELTFEQFVQNVNQNPVSFSLETDNLIEQLKSIAGG